MKTKTFKIFAIMSFLLICSNTIMSQTLGTKKNIILSLTSYECGDFCYLELKDIKTGKTYSFDNIDEKTKDNGVLDKIQELYYKYEESDKKIIGKKYIAVIEFRKTDELAPSESTEEGPKKTGRKITKWMINSLNNVSK